MHVLELEFCNLQHDLLFSTMLISNPMSFQSHRAQHRRHIPSNPTKKENPVALSANRVSGIKNNDKRYPGVSDITVGELADDLMDVERHNETEDEDSQESLNADIGMQIDQEEMAPQSFFHTALEIRKLLKNSGGVDGWPPDSSDLTLENAIDSVPVRLFNFIAWSVEYSQDPVMDERVPVSQPML